MVEIFNHPLIKTKLTTMRNKDTSHDVFRKNLNEIASLMVFEVLRDYKPRQATIKTPIGEETTGYFLDKEIVIVPILRAGLGMVQGILDLVPQARVGHIGIYRDEKTFEAIDYFYKVPNVSKDSYVLVVDPMLATGVSAYDAINRLKQEGFTNIKLVCLVGVDKGVERIQQAFPDVDIYLATKDDYLNENNYIVPGLGDAGDRLFGTK
ncbi:uracil phosphoribosyltransferase [Mycoplasma zalophi]|uniref:Uracil phosphoribosyltransferase n=1 Tax=Mycoplasma zalophi TaxID=191287 RepID=A0ABS6DQ70_9MOLU|nr:uracil phosphoribosyltransferase [Mycoplasma zalophi]MBU4690786.1 uracil phosphoribosyltransferase [Mycoplasma zalophi]MBU4692398.1 uracil phosphoribosyltransferase [Mycoplasma zalophi]